LSSEIGFWLETWEDFFELWGNWFWIFGRSQRNSKTDAMAALEAALASQVQRYLDAYVYENARFLAERLVAHVSGAFPREMDALRASIQLVKRLYQHLLTAFLLAPAASE
jgi:hypothetical protein